MRLISEDPGFTWGGTFFIVMGFTLFGLTQSIVAAARRRGTRRSKLTVLRVIGIAGMLPLFVAAGSVMFPTVIGGGLALARDEWHKVTRGICLAIAKLPVLFVGNDLVGSFGWSWHTLAGLVGLLAIYATISGGRASPSPAKTTAGGHRATGPSSSQSSCSCCCCSRWPPAASSSREGFDHATPHRSSTSLAGFDGDRSVSDRSRDASNRRLRTMRSTVAALMKVTALRSTTTSAPEDAIAIANSSLSAASVAMSCSPVNVMIDASV
jgi:hypothetical protein